MRDKKEFYSILQGVAGRPYREYVKLVGDFDFSRYVLKISQVAAEGQPTLFVVRVPQAVAAFPPHVFSSPVRRTALEDLLARSIAGQIDAIARAESGVSRRWLSVARPGQKILPRTAVVVTDEFVEARLYITLPLPGGKIDADEIAQVFFEDLPRVVNQGVLFCNLDGAAVERFVDVMEDADQIRQVLPTLGLVAFTGVDSRPGRRPDGDLPDPAALALTAAPELLRDIEVPNAGVVRGICLPSGVTLLLGDEYSGRREWLRALAAGIYNHVPGDGRERIVSVPDAVHLRAQPGRSVQRVDLSAFRADAAGFTARAADAFSSQAAALVEAVEVGARVLLLDESDSSPAFLGLDDRLRPAFAHSPLAGLADLARSLVDDLGVSLVVAGAGALSPLVPVADLILLVEQGVVRDVTAEVKAAFPAPAPRGSLAALAEQNRWIIPTSLDPSRGRFDEHVLAQGLERLEFGRSTVDLTGLEQLADTHQAATIGHILAYAKERYMDEGRPIRELLDLIDRDLSTEGLECLSRELRGDFARPRRYEIAAVLNRLDTLRISHTSR
jgi:predicted ABC-class ATPase